VSSLKNEDIKRIRRNIKEREKEHKGEVRDSNKSIKVKVRIRT
jgi:hypothetical protein